MLALLIALFFDLRLAASLEGLRVRATLHNDGATAVEVVVNDACSGPNFKLVVDTVTRPFATTGKRCTAPQPQKAMIAPGANYSILSDALDGRMHHLVVSWQDLQSPMVVMPTLLRLEVKLSATRHARPGAPVDLEIAHVNRSDEDIVIAACGEDRLLVDGQEGPLPAPSPCSHEARTLAPRGAVITHGIIRLGAGRHLLRARWHDAQSDDTTVDVGD